MENENNLNPQGGQNQPEQPVTPPQYQNATDQPQPNYGYDPNNFNNFGQQPQGPPPANNLPLAIIATIVGCCGPYCTGFILGIVAIVFATQVNSKFAQGDIIGAEKAAKTSKILSLITIGLAVIGLIWSYVEIQQMGGLEAYINTIKEAAGIY